MTATINIANATRLGYLTAEDGDGVVLNLLGRARGRVQKDKAPTLHTGGGETGVTVMTDDNNLTIRKLTPRECLRLQAYSDEEIDRLMDARKPDGKPKYPKTALYRFAGNSVCVECFVRITEAILDDMEGGPKKSSLDYWGAVE